MNRGKKKLGAILLDCGAISEDQLADALQNQAATGGRLGKIIVSKGFIPENEMYEILSAQLGLELCDLATAQPPAPLLNKIPESFARKHSMIPIYYKGGLAHVAVSDPLNLAALDEVEARLCCKVKAVIAREEDISNAIMRFYNGDNGMSWSFEHPEPRSNMSAEPKGKIAKLVDSLIQRAAIERASDIHFEPEEDSVGVRFRIDGVMIHAGEWDKEQAAAMISRIKILGGMDIGETRLPQDGSFKIGNNPEFREMRVSTFPTVHGESMVIRILGGGAAIMLGDTGLSGRTLKGFTEAVKRPWGLVVVTGPTGAGKTTTLYAALRSISSPEKTIISIEDPVECRLKHVRQSQVNLKTGLTFASGLRSILRQDPDVIMVGEVRDEQTAQIAVAAAMTGRLVLTTMHTGDAASAFTRLMDLGVEPYKIASTLKGALAQRLVRKVCEKCGGAQEDVACAQCNGAGHRGRTGIFEFIAPDEGMAALVMGRPQVSAIREYAINVLGMETMAEDGMKKVLGGVTTRRELDRAVDHA
ncbi:MAG: type II/IV secretion system protein [Nitrospinae bacterium]|nr:type II/IV secretion system protein [Nitrospinota bacterium]